MKQFIQLDKEDIVTSRLGVNYAIGLEKPICIILTEDAMQELIKDVQVMKEREMKEKESQLSD